MELLEKKTFSKVCLMYILGKEVQMKHQAPVLGVRVVDHRGYPIPDPTDVHYQRSKPADLTGSHRVLICTEEQIKVY